MRGWEAPRAWGHSATEKLITAGGCASTTGQEGSPLRVVGCSRLLAPCCAAAAQMWVEAGLVFSSDCPIDHRTVVATVGRQPPGRGCSCQLPPRTRPGSTARRFHPASHQGFQRRSAFGTCLLLWKRGSKTRNAAQRMCQQTGEPTTCVGGVPAGAAAPGFGAAAVAGWSRAWGRRGARSCWMARTELHCTKLTSAVGLAIVGTGLSERRCVAPPCPLQEPWPTPLCPRTVASAAAFFLI